MPKISVIVPVYKVEEYLNRCVDSILNQTFKDFELILVDDGSPDHCPAICDDYASKYSFIHVIHKENGGLSDARNAGIDWAFENSDSEWITFVDSDDWVHKKYLELLYETAVNNDVDVCSCGHYKVAGPQVDGIINHPDICIGTVEQLLVAVNNYWFFNLDTACSRLYKKNCFKTIHFPVGKLHEDAYVSYKILFLCNRNAVVKEILYYYFQNENGIMNSVMSLKRLTDHLDAFEERIRFFYDNKSIILFQKSFLFFCNMVEGYYEEYKHKKTYLKELTKRKKTIKRIIKKCHNFLPESVKKRNYRKATIVYQSKKRDFENDFRSMKKEKGVVFSIFWAIKTVVKNKIVYAYYIVLGNIILLKQELFCKKH